MKQKENAGNWDVVIPSSLAMIEPVIQQIISELKGKGFASNRLSELHLALFESISNAMKHGNKLKEDKEVKIKWRYEKNGLRISVEDEGEGFNPDDVPSPTSPENIMKESGRGIHFIKQLSKETKYNKKGNRLSFLFSK